MKKNVIPFFCILLSGLVFHSCTLALGARAAPELRSVEKIIDVPNNTQNEIYIKVVSWFVESNPRFDSFIEFKDKEEGKILGKFTFPYSEDLKRLRIEQTISVDVKPEKLRIRINDPMYRVVGGLRIRRANDSSYPFDHETGIVDARKEWEGLIKSLEAYLKKNDRW